jgi:hypothetical protein
MKRTAVRTLRIVPPGGKEITVTLDCSMYAIKKIEIKLADGILLR